MTARTAISSQLPILAAKVAVPAAEADADSATMQSILSVLPEAVRDAGMEHLQSRQAACCPVSRPDLPCTFHGLHLQMWRISYHHLQMGMSLPLHTGLQTRAVLHSCTHGLVQMLYT